MVDVREIHPLTDFLRNHKAHIQRIKETRTPEVLTVNGKAELVVLDPESYQEMQERLQRMETIAAIREGLAAAERGETKPAEQVFEEMKAKYDLQG
jgi:PHD/YefM family antitoxin component YafN of YafNO toxin-antitoxin module